jgi:hypothetical protein
LLQTIKLQHDHRILCRGLSDCLEQYIFLG